MIFKERCNRHLPSFFVRKNAIFKKLNPFYFSYVHAFWKLSLSPLRNSRCFKSFYFSLMIIPCFRFSYIIKGPCKKKKRNKIFFSPFFEIFDRIQIGFLFLKANLCNQRDSPSHQNRREIFKFHDWKHHKTLHSFTYIVQKKEIVSCN